MTPSEAYRCLYTRIQNLELELAILEYAEDIPIIERDSKTMIRAKMIMQQTLKMTDLVAL